MADSRKACSDGARREDLRQGAQPPVPEAVKEAQRELDRVIAFLASEGPDRLEAQPKGGHVTEGRDLYLIVSSRGALVAKYGRLGFEQLDSDLYRLKEAVRQHTGLGCALVYVDEEASGVGWGLKPVDARNPWQIKRLIDRVDDQVKARGGVIRYVLIVGGDRIIPFHRLSNPVDDQDADVPSDNPYACRDTNYLIPERAVGRLPDGDSEGLGFLHALIETAADAHRRRMGPKGLFGVLGGQITGLSHAIQALTPIRANGRGLGYSASIWRKASRAVFSVIGDDSQLRTCPPLTYEGFRIMERPYFGYFNLHGIEDGPNWYGQRDTLFPADYPLFPLALRPQDLSAADYADSVIFTEACYGANIVGKNVRDAMALRFLEAQALAVVGSTKVAYGSIAPPLLGADLVGRYFWEGLRAHLTAGEALRYAKANLAREMQERQGYLDGEDQKALISFVLYGDPSLPITAIHGSGPVRSVSKGVCPPIICQRESEAAAKYASDDLVSSVKGRIQATLPHMSDARVRAKPLPVCDGTCQKPCSPPTAREKKGLGSGRAHGHGRQRSAGWAVTFEKSISVRGDGNHHQVVKVVVDDSGHVLRMSVSK